VAGTRQAMRPAGPDFAESGRRGDDQAEPPGWVSIMLIFPINYFWDCICVICNKENRHFRHPPLRSKQPQGRDAPSSSVATRRPPDFSVRTGSTRSSG
jgi:hypothetical protein